jgi:anaerobic magnesium-protoporphyrin IX monomethyl ester cyclase
VLFQLITETDSRRFGFLAGGPRVLRKENLWYLEIRFFSTPPRRATGPFRPKEGGAPIQRSILLYQPLTNIFDRGKALPTQPLSLLSAARRLRGRYRVVLINACSDPQWKKSLQEELERERPVCLGTTSITGNQVFSSLEAVTLAARQGGVPIVWGGIHGTLFPDMMLNEAPVDVVVRKEGEDTFPEVLEALEGGSDLQGIPGISFRRDHQVVHNPDRPWVDLETLPEVPYDWIRGPVHFLTEGKPTLYLETSRGCFSGCTYCYNQAYHQRKWRAQSSEKVLARIRELLQRFPAIGHLSLVDDNYFGKPERTREIAEGLLRMGVPVTYQVQGAHIEQISRMEDADFDLLARSGCVRLDMGVESGSPEILQRVKKKIHPQQVIQINRKLARSGIRPWFNFMAGFPGETAEDLRRTRALIFRLLRENPSCLISPVYPLAPYPGTELFREAVGLGFRPPEHLEEWKNYHLANRSIPWLDDKRRKQIQAMYFLSIFVDEKLQLYDTKHIYRVLARLYRPVARFRLKHGFFKAMPELSLFQRLFDTS